MSVEGDYETASVDECDSNTEEASALGISEDVSSVANTLTDEITNRIKNYAKAFEYENIGKLTKDTLRAVEKRILLQGVELSDREEDVGRILGEDIENTITMHVCEELWMVVEYNYNLQLLNRDSIDVRIETEQLIRKTIIDSNRKPILPDINVMEFTINSRIKKMIKNNPLISEERLAAMKLEIREEENERYIDEYNVYREELKRKNIASNLIDELKAKKERCSIVEQVTKNFIDILQVLTQKVKFAIVKFPMIRNQLQQLARIKKTKQVIANPHDSNSLPGMYALISEHYLQKSFVSFTNTIIENMSFSISEDDSNRNPKKAAQYVQKLYYSWERKNMWNQFSKDQYFSAILIKGLHPRSPIRQAIVSEVSKYIRILDQEKKKNNGTKSSEVMPIFTFVIDYIHEYEKNKQFDKEH